MRNDRAAVGAHAPQPECDSIRTRWRIARKLSPYLDMPRDAHCETRRRGWREVLHGQHASLLGEPKLLPELQLKSRPGNMHLLAA